jgi:hypothetical protein
MSIEMKPIHIHSTEFEIDQSVDDLIRKLVAGELSQQEEALYNQLLARRSRLMRVNVRRRAIA